MRIFIDFILFFRHKRPFDKGNMYITFEIKFPESNWTDSVKMAQLEKILPERKVVVSHGKDAVVDECTLTAVDPRSAKATDYEDEGDEDEEQGGQRGGPGVQCAQQ